MTADFLCVQIRCHQYWPEDNKPVTVFGDILITKLMEDIQIDWTIRDLKIERVKIKLKEKEKGEKEIKYD